MRRAVLSTFLFVAILGLGCMGVVTLSNADEHCEDPYDPNTIRLRVRDMEVINQVSPL